MTVSRRDARKSALTLLYQWDVTERAPGELYEGEIDAYAQQVTDAVVRDNNRHLAIERARRALSELEIEGVPTTRDVAYEILGSERFRSGDYSTSFLDEVALAAHA